MKKRLLSILLALCMALSLLPTAALAADGPAATSNAHSQNYTINSSTVNSYLFENGSGGLTRVEYVPARGSYTMQNNKLVFVPTSEERLIVEDYSSGFVFQRGYSIPTELSIWGGFYAGENYNFFVFGQKNSDSNDSTEVVRVVKYSKDWKRLGQASLYGANTKTPFENGSLRCAENNGELYIRTCHTMYNGHQANMSICVRESDMTVLDYVASTGPGYVSHSVNQFILVDQQQRIVTWDHGDAYPRSAVLMAYKTPAGNGKFSGSVTDVTIQGFPGTIMDNATGASLGGLAETSSGYVMVHNYDEKGTSTSGIPRRVCFTYVSKDSLSGPRKAISDAGTMTPVLASTGLNGGYVLWNACDAKGSGMDTLYYRAYAADGSLGETRTATAVLSDCQPICFNGRVVWYTTNNSAPVFYALDQNGVAASKSSAGSENTPRPAPDPTPNTPPDTDPANFWIEGSELVQYKGSASNVRIPDGITIIDAGAFDRCSNLVSVTIPDSVTRIGGWAFSSCTSLASLVIPDGVTTIQSHLFFWCTGLTSVTIPASVTKIGEDAFYGCDSLKDIYYGGSESQWNQIKVETVTPHGNDALHNATIHFNSYPATAAKPENGSGIDSADGGTSPSGSLEHQITLPTTSNGTVTAAPASAKAGEKVTITTTPDNGYTTGGVTVTDSSGNRVSVTNHGGGNYTFTMPSGQVTVSAAFVPIQNTSATPTTPASGTSTAFTDVSKGEWYADAVEWAVETDITNGTSDGTNGRPKTFSPNKTCTQAEILTFLYRAARGEGAAAAEDMAKAVSWARGKGMIDNTFDSGKPCTRSTAMHYIWQAFGSLNAAGTSFTDVPASADYANAVSWAVANGITNGYGNTFRPGNICTRAEIVTFLHRAYIPAARLTV